jgi:two-component sensor histidine kinase
MIHRHLYRTDQDQEIDAAGYIAELCADVVNFLGPEWTDRFLLDLTPMTLSTDRVVSIGLVLTEFLINATRYAYNGQAGPIEIRLSQDNGFFCLSVIDQGLSRFPDPDGIGSKILNGLSAQLEGELTLSDNEPGLRASLCASISDPRRPGG